MATFTFDNTLNDTIGVTGDQTLTYSENGVNFTWSVTNGDGSNVMGIGGGSIYGFASGATNQTTQDIFTLDVTGPSQTQFDGTIQFTVSSLFGTWTVNGQPLVSGVNTLTGPQASLVFTSTFYGGNNFKFFILGLTATVNCFTAGTAIATPTGPRAVETLDAGDPVLTADGGETTVKWLGEQHVDTRLTHPAKVNPVRIRAGALGHGLPHRDLLLSPDHAIELDGYLVNAGALVNGTTITREVQMPREGFSYYHIDTGKHELLMAEGVAAESFIDYAGRDNFDNAELAAAQLIPEMPLPRISSARTLPDTLRDRLTPRHAA